MQLSWQEYLDQRRLRVKTIILWSVFLIYILLLTLKPFDFSIGYFYQFFKFQHGVFYALFSSFKLTDILLNILFFIPFGFLTGLWFRLNQHEPADIIQKSTRLSLLVSLLAEILQLFLIRTTSVTDILTNTFGGYLGARFVCQISLEPLSIVLQFIVNRGTRLIKLTSLIYTLLLIFLFSIPFWLNGFYNWDENYYLLLGDEATGDRPWEGVIYELVIYDRMLNQEEALQSFYSRRSESLKQHILAHYRFDEGQGRILYNRAAGANTFNLEISDTALVRWQPSGNGLVIHQGGFLKSTAPALQLCQALKATNQFSLEIRFQPANLHQTGPGRIVSLSASTDKRNFTLGQAGGKLNFRVRTPLTGLNGSRVDLYTEDSVLTHRPQHVIAVFNRGAELLYLNGHELEGSVRGLSNYMSYLSGFGRGTFGKISLCFLMLFPLGWLGQVTVGRTQAKWLRGIFINILPVFLVVIVFFVFYHQPVDLPILAITMFTGGLTCGLSRFPHLGD